MIKCRYPNLAAAQEAVTKCGETVIKWFMLSRASSERLLQLIPNALQIATIGVPKQFGPMIFTFAGDGKVNTLYILFLFHQAYALIYDYLGK